MIRLWDARGWEVLSSTAMSLMLTQTLGKIHTAPIATCLWVTSWVSPSLRPVPGHRLCRGVALQLCGLGEFPGAAMFSQGLKTALGHPPCTKEQ